MKRRIIFIGGIHGVGKSTVCSSIASQLNIPHYSASELIQNTKQGLFTNKKTVANVENNQNVLLGAINSLAGTFCFLLDGHFSLFDENGEVKLIPSETFKAIDPVAICVLTGDVKLVVERIAARDGIQHSIEAYENLNISELAHARTIAELLDVPIFIYNTSDDMVELGKFIGSHLE